MNGPIDGTYVVVPALNEATVIEGVIRDLARVCPRVICVDDGSTDGTGALAEKAGAFVVRHPVNLGQGAALQTGITVAVDLGAKYVVTFDGDGQHDPQQIPSLVRSLVELDVEVALGSRFMGEAPGIRWHRRLLLKAARQVNFFLSGLLLTDAHNGFRAFTRSAAVALNLRQPGMAHATEIVAQVGRAKMKFVEVPVTISYTDYAMAKGQRMSNSIHILFDLLLRSLLQ